MTTQRIKVPQIEGEISIVRAGSEAEVYPVVDGGFIDIPTQHVDGFLRQVPGSEVMPSKRSAGNPGTSAAGDGAGSKEK